MDIVYYIISFTLGVLAGLFILRIIQVSNRAHGVLIINTSNPDEEFMKIDLDDDIEDLIKKNYIEMYIIKLTDDTLK